MPEHDRPDAVILPDSYKYDSRAQHRVGAVLGHAERLLAVNKGDGEQAHTSPIAGGGGFFCYRGGRTARQTMFFHKLHERSGYPRYTWTVQPDGLQVGYLVPDAEETTVENA